MIGEAVNHPVHYNSHPSGVECIDVIRHHVCDIANAMKYMWRCGLKGEEGMTRCEKEIEDCRKAVWYLMDYLSNPIVGNTTCIRPHPSGLSCDAVVSCYCEDISAAFRSIWTVGMIVDGGVAWLGDEHDNVRYAVGRIEAHISKLMRECRAIQE